MGFKNSFKCYDCSYYCRKSILGRNVALRWFSVPLWFMLLMLSIVVIAIAVPTSWRLLAQGSITIRAATAGSATVETIDPPGGDFAGMVLESGQGLARDIVFKVDVSGVAYVIEGIYVGYNPYPPYKRLRFLDCRYGNSPTNMSGNCFRYVGMSGSSYSENGWVYDKWNFDFPTLTPGRYYLKLALYLEPSYPEQDTSFNFKIYINFRESR